MAPLSKPEAVLKQAEKLVSVGQNHAALQSLTEMFSSKRFRSTPIASLEPILYRFIELCVDMRKGRTAKEGLMQYKNIAQNSSVQSIEAVITKFVQLADAKVAAAQEQAAVQSAVDVDDLEASETPESILLGAVSGDQSKDRTDRALVTPWLKFLWESYRTSLETLKNNARLEAIYQQIAQQAFKFCLKHQRKVEFRRLCDTLRLHLANVAKYAHQPHSINLSDPEVLQHHLDTRFAQLNTSVELELWQEAFRTVEDVHNLLTMAKKAPRPAMMADYYDKLTKIFLMSGNALYHAAAWNKYYSVATTLGVKTEEETTRLCGQVLVSALAVPVGHTADEPEEVKGKNARLNALLGLNRMPTRSGLLNDALSRDVLKHAPESIKSLYQILEVTFDPLTLCTSVAPLLKGLAADEGYASYLPLLQRALLSRLLSQLSQVYGSIKIANLLALIAPLRNVSADNTFDEEQVEAYIMGCARRGELSVRVDHKEGSLTFIDDPFATIDDTVPIAGPSSRGESFVQPSTSELVRTRLSKVATCLHKSLQIIEPQPAGPTPEEKAAKFKELVTAVEAERKALQLRRSLIARRRELLSELSVKKEKEESTRLAEKLRKEKEEESRRRQEELKKKEVERTKKEIESIRADEAKKYAQTLVEKGILKANDVEKMENYDTEALITIQVGQLEKEKKETTERLRIISKRIDHIERAYRKEERPLLAEDYKRQQDQDRANFEALQKARIENARLTYQENVATKARLSRMTADFNARRDAIVARKGEEFARKKEAAQKKIQEEKEKRRKAVLKKREEERLAKEKEEAEQRRLEEERRRQEEERRAEEERLRREAEEEARKAEEAKAKLEEEAAARRAERERERAEAAEANRRQREREEEAERRREERRLAEKQQQQRISQPTAVRGTASREPGDVWRRSTPSATTRGTATPPRTESPAPASSGVYKPPFAAASSGPPGGGWRARAAAAAAAGGGGAGGPGPGPGNAPPAAVPSRVAPGSAFRPSSPAPAREEAKADDDGFTPVAKKEVYRPKQRRV